MNRTVKIILIIVIILFIAGIILYPSLKKDKDVEPQKVSMPASGGVGKGTPLNINVKVIQPEALLDIIRVSTANIIPDEEVELTFESPGKITDIFFQEGSHVNRGQLLAKVNDKPLQAELQKLQAQIPLFEDRVFRQKSLLEKDAVSKEAYEQVDTELNKLNADIELVKARIAQTELRAPFDGIVGLRNVSEGAYASPTTVITSLTKIIPLKVEFSVNEKQADFIGPGTNIIFQTPPDLATYKATIYAVESRLDQNTYTLKVRAIYPNTSGRLRPGRSANVEIQTGEIKNALVIPSEAIIAEMGRDIAYIYSGGKAKQVELIKGIRTESNIQILEGLNQGDTLIISGIMQLRDGLSVSIDNVNN
ncbi:MAG: efflux RND transporter periplasmic adaptor subunit [Dysgonamonadaceae bacterium]|jgi:membrane fusion protein (multidrug efflux system)|nr:efflux RND transporter periplasmic adaptor subunit [Dysgonamonadaceae bacterium]